VFRLEACATVRVDLAGTELEPTDDMPSLWCNPDRSSFVHTFFPEGAAAGGAEACIAPWDESLDCADGAFWAFKGIPTAGTK
jgi:hypothetical protein